MSKSKLVEVREGAGFRTPEAASGVVGFSSIYLRRLENGQTPITGNALVKLADGYGLGVDELRVRLGMAPRKRRLTRRNGANAA